MQTTTALGGSQRRVRRGTQSGSSRTQKEASLHNINNIIINGSGEARRDGTVRTTGNSSVATLKEEEIINSNSLKVHKAKMLVVVAFAAAATAVAVTVAINRQRKVLCVPHSSASCPATFTACAMAVQLPTSDWLTELSGLPGLRRLFAAAIVAGSVAAAAVSVCAGIGIAAIGIGIGNGNG